MEKDWREDIVNDVAMNGWMDKFTSFSIKACKAEIVIIIKAWRMCFVKAHFNSLLNKPLQALS